MELKLTQAIADAQAVKNSGDATKLQGAITALRNAAEQDCQAHGDVVMQNPAWTAALTLAKELQTAASKLVRRVSLQRM